MARYRKFLVALAAALTTIAGMAIDTRITHVAAAVIAVLGAFGVYAVPNKGA